MLRLWYAMRARTLRVIALALLTGVIGCGTIYLSDAAVDLAKCVNESAARMSASRLDSARADCAVHDGRTVTAVLLSDTTLPPLPGDRVVALLRELGLPEDAIFYHGPDSPSIGLPVNVMGRVYVYDGAYSDNRKYSTTNSLSRDVSIPRSLSKTGNRFSVELRRSPRGAVEVTALH